MTMQRNSFASLQREKEAAVEALLSGAVSYAVEEDTVVFSIEE